uniref:Uncharacterized protein n=1 Tax=Oryza glaberrima TaxID=4538 RepID=I1R0B3_ORYGL
MGTSTVPSRGLPRLKAKSLLAQRNWAKLSLGTPYRRGPSPNPKPPSKHRRHIASATLDQRPSPASFQSCQRQDCHHTAPTPRHRLTSTNLHP